MDKKIHFFGFCFIVVIFYTFYMFWDNISTMHMKIHLFNFNQNDTPSLLTKIIDTSTNIFNVPNVNKTKVILLWTGFFGQKLWWFKNGNQGFKDCGCKESRCFITSNKKYLNISSSILFHMRDLGPGSKMPKRNYDQDWIFAIFESPIHTYYTDLPKYRYAFNKTFSYKRGSDLYHLRGIVTPKEQVTSTTVPLDAKNRTKLTLWYLSNCAPHVRRNYGRELSRYVPVDIFGSCGKRDPCRNRYQFNCTKATKLKYKFYLAFENSRCPDYITEKFWWSLRDGIVPIVLGAKISDYERVAPPNSFIHVDNFTSPQHLANYIKYLDKNDEAYYQYHMWRNTHTLKTKELELSSCWCELCSMQYETRHGHSHRDIAKFWSRGECF